ncbi:MAG: methyltransferase domain-containing protein [Armatimonadota bacterium]|nr:methyltransferase domain-containing protein [Armatimonadota bacterium]
MRREELHQMYELEDQYWWFIGRRRIVHRLIEFYGPQRDDLRILDAGCGTGGTLVALRDLGEAWGCDISQQAVTLARTRGLSDLRLCDVVKLTFEDESFDVVVSCDVLEHVEQDALAMREMARVLKPGGLLVVTVPAHMFLWSEHDEALAHLRRYEPAAFRGLVEGAGLRVQKMTQAVALALPAVLLYRAWRRLSGREGRPKTSLVRLPRPLNRVLVWMLDIENAVIPYLSLPLGTSLVAAAVKPEDAQ